MRETLIVIRSKCEESITVVRKTVRRHQSHRFFTPYHCSVSRFSLKAFSTPFRMTLEGKSVIIKGTLSVIQSASEESMPLVRKTVRRHQRNRFFTLCHCPVSRLSHKAFLPPFWITILGKHVIMKETLSVIISGHEGSVPPVRTSARRHSEQQRRIYTRGEENGKKIKAISCELSAAS